jgi:hypothetical protein
MSTPQPAIIVPINSSMGSEKRVVMNLNVDCTAAAACQSKRKLPDPCRARNLVFTRQLVDNGSPVKTLRDHP